MKSMPKSRKGAAASDVADQERKLSQQIEHSVRLGAAQYLEEHPEWIDELTPALRADVIKSQIPKPMPIDQNLEASYLSLSSSIAALPSVPDLTKYVSTLKLQLKKALDWARIERRCAQEACKKNDAQWVREIVMQSWHHGVAYGREMRARKLTVEDVDVIVEAVKNKKARKPDAVKS